MRTQCAPVCVCVCVCVCVRESICACTRTQHAHAHAHTRTHTHTHTQSAKRTLCVAATLHNSDLFGSAGRAERSGAEPVRGRIGLGHPPARVWLPFCLFVVLCKGACTLMLCLFVVWCEGSCKLFLLRTALSAADLSRCAAEYSRTVPRRRVHTYGAAPQSNRAGTPGSRVSQMARMERPMILRISTVEYHTRPPPRPAAPPLVPVSTAQRPVPLPRGTADGTVPA